MKKIKQIKRMLSESDGIKKAVITEALNRSTDDSELFNWFSNIVNYRTDNGSVGKLFYTIHTQDLGFLN